MDKNKQLDLLGMGADEEITRQLVDSKSYLSHLTFFL